MACNRHDFDVFKVEDPNVVSVMRTMEHRAAEGLKKYKTTTADNPIGLLDWLNHLQEELMDATIYIERLKNEI